MTHQAGDGFIDDFSSFETGTSVTFQDSLENGPTKDADSRILFEGRKSRGYNTGTRVYRYRKKKNYLSGNFSAPAGVNPYHAASSNARKYSG